MEKKIHIATCHTCHFPIYRGEAIYRSRKGEHSGSRNYHYYSGISESKEIIQCQWCIDQYNKELQIYWNWKKRRNLLKNKIMRIVEYGIPTLVTFMLLYYNFREGKFAFWSYLVIFFMFWVVSLAFLSPLVWWLLKLVRIITPKTPIKHFQPVWVDKYKFRRNYRPWILTENCHYCDKFIPKESSTAWSKDFWGKEEGKFWGRKFISKLKECHPICYSCWNIHEEN